MTNMQIHDKLSITQKVPCGGFVLGQGLSMQEDMICADVDTWLFCVMQYQTHTDIANPGGFTITQFLVTDAEKNILFNYKPESPSGTTGFKEVVNWMGEHNRLNNFGFGTASEPNDEDKSVRMFFPWIKTKIQDRDSFSGGKLNYHDTTYRFYNPELKDLYVPDPNSAGGYFTHYINIAIRKRPEKEFVDFYSVSSHTFLLSKWQQTTT